MKRLLSLAVAASVVGCTTVPPAAHDAVERAQLAANRIFASAELVLPMLTPAQQLRARAIMAAVTLALAAAASATTPAERNAQLKEAQDQVTDLSGVVAQGAMR